MKIWLKVAPIVLVLILLSGCWDSKSVRETSYVTGLGLDYRDQMYYVYAQMLDFTFISKNDGLNGSPRIAAVVGKSSSSMLNSALTKLYRTLQHRTSWAMTGAVLIGEQGLKERGGLFFWDGLLRYQEFRLTQWIFGSKGSLEKILLQGSFFDKSPLQTIVQSPKEIYKQNSEIKPITLAEYGAQMNEPARTVILPSLILNDEVWSNSEAKDPKPMIDGAFFIYKSNYLGWLSLQDLRGLRWAEEDTERTPLHVDAGDSRRFVISIKQPKIKVVPTIQADGSPIYDLIIHLRGVIRQIEGDFSDIDEMEKLASKAVEKEIRHTFEKGMSIHADVFNFEHDYYKRYSKRWEAAGEKVRATHPGALRQVQIQVKIENSGMFKQEMLR